MEKISFGSTKNIILFGSRDTVYVFENLTFKMII